MLDSRVFTLIKDIDRLSKAKNNDIEKTNDIVHKAAVQGKVSSPD